MSCPESDLAPYVIVLIASLLSDTIELPQGNSKNVKKLTLAAI